MNLFTRRFVSLFSLLSLSAAAQVTVPRTISFSARVANGSLPLDGPHNLDLKLFDVATGGAALWTEAGPTQLNQGLVSLVLGNTNAFAPTLFDGRPLFMELTIDGSTLSPRLQISSVPYALRSAVAASAERLGNQLPTDFAAAAHTHNGAYLPLSTSLTCPGTQKMVALSASGAVVCADDQGATYTAGSGVAIANNQVSVSFAGSGAAATAARSDHTHAGAYVPVNTATCPAGQKSIGTGTDGAPVCAADLNTSYTAGSGLSLSGTQFSTAFAGSGTAPTSARSDHGHTYTCPTGFTSHWWSTGVFPEGTAVLCVKPVSAPNVTWVTAARSCAVNHAASRLCTTSELTVLRMANTPSHVQVPLFSNYWLGDRTGDNLAMYTNATSGDDFDAEININLNVEQGYYCCTGGTFFR